MKAQPAPALLRAFRAAGWNDRQLSRAVGVPAKGITRVMNGTKQLSPEQESRLRALECSPPDGVGADGAYVRDQLLALCAAGESYCGIGMRFHIDHVYLREIVRGRPSVVTYEVANALETARDARAS